MSDTANQFHFRKTVIEAFTEGDCWVLAQYLRDRTGWDIVALGFKNEDHIVPEERYWEHQAIRMPDGRLLDVTGVHEEDTFMEMWVSNDDNCCLFNANSNGYREGQNRLFLHSAQEYGDEILAALSAHL